MKKISFLFIGSSLLFSYTPTLTKAKKELSQTSQNINIMNKKLHKLANEIIKKQKEIKYLNYLEHKTQNEIKTLEANLKDSNKILKSLENQAHAIKSQQNEIKNEIIKFISENYYLDTQQVTSLEDLIYSEINKKALNQYSYKIKDLIAKFKLLSKNLNEINQKIASIKAEKKALLNKQQKLIYLKKRRYKELANLKKQKENYKQKLLSMLEKQKNLRKKLKELKIVKQTPKININVKKVGSAYLKPKTARYYGRKTIPPVYGSVVKKFGSYIDPIYKIRIYNDSITIKTKPNSFIRAIFNGKVVYIGENGGKKVIFIKHPNNMFSIYSNLEKISPLIKKGSYVKKGQIIARVKNSLEFEITYKDKPINPLQVINLK